VGGGLAGHNGLKSLRRHLGDPGFARVRIGVGRPDSTDPDIVANYVLARFSEPKADVQDLIDRSTDAAERLIWRGWQPTGLPLRGDGHCWPRRSRPRPLPDTSRGPRRRLAPRSS
jgi:hypothetical protein